MSYFYGQNTKGDAIANGFRSLSQNVNLQLKMLSKMCIKLHRNLQCFLFVFNKKIAHSDMIRTEVLSVFIFT